MRLTRAELTALMTTVATFAPPGSKLLLFGSRSKDSLRGGDIDLALIISDQKKAEGLKLIDYQILAALKAHPAIGDQKIDLKIINLEESLSTFFKSALENAVEIGKF